MNSSAVQDAYTVSVIIPAYNAAEFISRAIDSVLAQTHRPDEIIVVDDGSTDATKETVARYGTKIIYIHQPNAGPGAARNKGIQTATSQFVAFLDADDEWLPDKLHLQTALLKANPNLTWAGTDFYNCLCQQKRKAPATDPVKAKKLLANKAYYQNYFAAFIAEVAGWTSTIIVKRRTIIDAGLFQTDSHLAEDIDTWFRIAHRNPNFGFVPRPLAIYHMQTGQNISIKYRDTVSYCDFLDRHLKLAVEANSAQAFEPCAAVQIKKWIRSLLFAARKDDIRQMLTHYKHLLSPCYIAIIRLLTISPKTTAFTCHAISRIIRTLKLRKKLTRPPK